MTRGHLESIFHTHRKGEECCREEEEEAVVEQNSVTSPEVWVMINSVASLAFQHPAPSLLPADSAACFWPLCASNA